MSIVLLRTTSDADAVLLESALRVEGLSVAAVETLTDLRMLLASQPCKLAFLDLMLLTDGGSHGLDLVRALRRDFPGTRVVLTSQYHLSERQLARADCGASAFVPKPFNVPEVVSFLIAKLSAPPSSRRIWVGDTSSD